MAQFENLGELVKKHYLCGMKQNLQPPATPLEMLSLFFPAGLLDYFDLVNHVSQETCFIFFS